MVFNRNELFLVYDPQSSLGKQTKALAMDLCSHINEVDVVRERLSPTYWKQLIDLLGVHPDDLLDHSHPDYKKKVSDHGYTMDGWLGVLVHESALVRYPIVVFQESAVMCRTPTDIMKLKPRKNMRPFQE